MRYDSSALMFISVFVAAAAVAVVELSVNAPVMDRDED